MLFLFLVLVLAVAFGGSRGVFGVDVCFGGRLVDGRGVGASSRINTHAHTCTHARTHTYTHAHTRTHPPTYTHIHIGKEVECLGT